MLPDTRLKCVRRVEACSRACFLAASSLFALANLSSNSCCSLCQSCTRATQQRSVGAAVTQMQADRPHARRSDCSASRGEHRPATPRSGGGRQGG
eukprot:6207611-Pleurochrysis_carterae.AAC.5